MKVLLVHNDYGKYSGEEAVVDKMALMLSSLGYDVAQLRMSTAGVRENITGKIRGFVSGLYCPSGVKAMRESIERERPDVVNVHNLYPFISPAALRECKKAGIPVVMTIHNFRLMCPTGLFMRYGKPCELCLQKGNEWGCVRYNCEQSILKSVGYAARNAVARIKRHYLDCVDVFACITDFQRQKLIAAGFPKEKLTVIPNSIDLVGAGVSKKEGSYIAYSGRISWEKGVDLIMEVARRQPKLQFRLAGAVREKELVENLPENVSLMGYLSGEELNRFYNGAKFFVMASRWYEGFPMTILETAQFGKPMVAPDHGGFTEIIGKGGDAIGRLFIPGDIDSLEKEVVGLWNNTDEVTRLGNAAYNKLNCEYSTQVISQKWADLLQSLTSKCRH
jgi:glycosyltransferase involved in cell wall biosynthesis